MLRICGWIHRLAAWLGVRIGGARRTAGKVFVALRRAEQWLFFLRLLHATAAAGVAVALRHASCRQLVNVKAKLGQIDI